MSCITINLDDPRDYGIPCNCNCHYSEHVSHAVACCCIHQMTICNLCYPEARPESKTIATLELTDKEISLLAAAVTDYFHKIKDEFGSANSLLPDDTLLAARNLWKKVMKELNVS